MRLPAAILPLLIPLTSTTIVSNEPEETQAFHESTNVCAGRSNLCEVLLDVPPPCVNTDGTSTCPVVFFLHGSGGTNDGFSSRSGVHDAYVIGVYPQGESCPNPGWNTGPKACNQCTWDDFACTKDPDEGAFVENIIDKLREAGASGNLYAVGNSNGAALAHRLAINLPFTGIVAKVTQLLASPERSGPGDLNWNQPISGDPVSVLQISGTADGLIPYEGGSSAVFSGVTDFQLMSVEVSNLSWAENNNCDQNLHSVTSVSSSVGTGADFYEYSCPDGIILEHYKVIGGKHGDTGGATLDGYSPEGLLYDFITRVERGANDGTPTTLSPVASPVASPTRDCVDSPDWHGKKGEDHTCAHVGEDVENRCNWFDTEGVPAYRACPRTCDLNCDSAPTVATLSPTLSPVAPPVSAPAGDCVDDSDWHGKHSLEHTCSYIGEKPDWRCIWVNEAGVIARDACPVACNMCETVDDSSGDLSEYSENSAEDSEDAEDSADDCVDSDTWVGKFNEEHNCAHVAEQSEFRCNWEDAEGVMASEACKQACGDCDEEETF